MPQEGDRHLTDDDHRQEATGPEDTRGDYRVQRDRLNPDHRLFGKVTSRTRQD